jgi:hypothetical protein
VGSDTGERGDWCQAQALIPGGDNADARLIASNAIAARAIPRNPLVFHWRERGGALARVRILTIKHLLTGIDLARAFYLRLDYYTEARPD